MCMFKELYLYAELCLAVEAVKLMRCAEPWVIIGILVFLMP